LTEITAKTPKTKAVIREYVFIYAAIFFQDEPANTSKYTKTAFQIKDPKVVSVKKINIFIPAIPAGMGIHLSFAA